MKNNFYKKYLIGLIIISFVFSNAFFAFPKKARAQWAVIDPSNLVQNTFSAIADGSMWTKEFLLDTIAWVINDQILHQMTRQTVNWINSGFKGNPAFITNPGDLLKDAADQATGVFFEEMGMAGICQPFRVRLELALRTGWPFAERMRCTLSDAIANVENFEKNFAAGGWAGWLAITTQPQNNIYGAYLEEAGELARRQEEQQSLVKLETSWGSGFLSTKKCVEIDSNKYNLCLENPAAGIPGSSAEVCEKRLCARYETETPGSAIENRLNDALGADFRRLEVADEINEILGAMINQFITSAVRSLRGGGGRGSAVETSQGTPLTENVRRGSSDLMDRSIADEQSYLDNKQKSLNIVEGRRITLLTFVDQCDEKAESLQEEVASSTALIAEAETYKTRVNSATTFEEVSKILDDYNNIMQPKMHSITEVAAATTEYAELKESSGCNP